MIFHYTKLSLFRLFQELESLYDEHFGRNGEEGGEDRRVYGTEAADEMGWLECQEEEIDTNKNTESRIQELIQSSNNPHENSNSESDTDEFNPETPDVCHCKNSNCLGQFDVDEINAHVLQVSEMTKIEKEMYIMGTLQLLGVDQKRFKQGERKRVRYEYVYGGKKVCRAAFQHIYDVGRRTLTALMTHMNKNGKVPRVHGNKGRRPHNTFKFEEIKYCVTYIVNYANEYGLPQPAAPRGRDGDPPIYLPAVCTKKDIHADYVKVCQQQTVRAVGRSTFKSIWNQCVPHIKISSPKDDVCQKCETFRKSIIDAVSENEKLNASETLKAHIEHSQRERDLYRQSIEEAKEETPAERQEGRLPALSAD